jgi:hypothetical protein
MNHTKHHPQTPHHRMATPNTTPKRRLVLGGLTKPDAKLIQLGLSAAGYLALPNPQGLPGPKTAAAYDRYHSAQEGHQPRTAGAGSSNAKAFRAAFVRALEGEVGTVEVGGNNRGQRIDAYEGATWLDPSGDWAWCASFQCWAIREALKATGFTPAWARPRTPGAYAFRDKWAVDNRYRGIRTLPAGADVLAGDLIVFTFSHIAAAYKDADRSKDAVLTVEGNTNSKGSRDGGGALRDGVYHKRRSRSLISAIIRVEEV